MSSRAPGSDLDHRPAEEHHRTIQRVNTEWLALCAGLKPGLRIATDSDAVASIVARYRGAGFHVVLDDGRVGIQARPRVLVYVARTSRDAAALRSIERLIMAPETTPRSKAMFTREFGLRLGYPPCCVDSFASRTERGGGRIRPDDRDRVDPDFVHALEAYVEQPDWRINNLLMRQFASLISFAPCRFDCARAGQQAAAILALVRGHAVAAEASLEAMLRRPLAIHPSGRRVWVQVTAARVTGAWPPCGMPGSIVDVGDNEAAALWMGAAVADGRLCGLGDPRPIVVNFH